MLVAVSRWSRLPYVNAGWTGVLIKFKTLFDVRRTCYMLSELKHTVISIKLEANLSKALLIWMLKSPRSSKSKRKKITIHLLSSVYLHLPQSLYPVGRTLKIYILWMPFNFNLKSFSLQLRERLPPQLLQFFKSPSLWGNILKKFSGHYRFNFHCCEILSLF